MSKLFMTLRPMESLHAMSKMSFKQNTTTSLSPALFLERLLVLSLCLGFHLQSSG